MNNSTLRRLLRRVLPVLAVLWMVWIWGNSLQTVEQSAARSQEVLETLRPVLEPVAEKAGVAQSQLHNLVRKSAHVLEFSVLTLLWLGTLSLRGRSRAQTALTALGLTALTAAADEGLQALVPGRGPQLRDVGIDLMGALAVTALFLAASAALRGFRQRRGEASWQKNKPNR